MDSVVPSRPLPLLARHSPNRNTEKSLGGIVSIVPMKFLHRLDRGREITKDPRSSPYVHSSNVPPSSGIPSYVRRPPTQVAELVKLKASGIVDDRSEHETERSNSSSSIGSSRLGPRQGRRKRDKGSLYAHLFSERDEPNGRATSAASVTAISIKDLEARSQRFEPRIGRI
ncbi:hypothetical protein HZH66_000035 [Vespula vulgaris]|uniref:Uncharacterized protein n=1 Tax=Vespula vulgaris TaxID=7454 RepID=A0A834NKH4_VESVU|nr:hypothetical protein HZH66_000035 [Vespula vulgaris]